MLKGMGNIHFVGIGGTGMSGIAKVLRQMGYTISGSDLHASEVTHRLEEKGIMVYYGHNQANIAGANTVVVSSAVPPDNEEVLAARSKGVRVMQRAEMLAAIMQQQRGIAIGGSHGKTTTTSMISLVLEKSGQDPTVIVGGELNDIGGNAKLGQGEYLVAEADESDGSFLKLSPEIVVVTNVENDHLDYYGSVEKIVEAFDQFINKIPEKGLAILCADDRNIQRIRQTLDRSYQTFGLREPADYQAVNIKWLTLGSSFDVVYRGQVIGAITLNVPGIHNVSNSLAAVAVGLHIGLRFTDIKSALLTFRGVHRRFQAMGEVGGVRVFDDYAHHPTEIRATLGAAKLEQGGRVIAIFQPHRYTRTKFLQDDFGTAFGDADMLIITDIYSAGEKPLEGINAGLIVERARSLGGKDPVYIPNREDIAGYLSKEVRPGDLVLTLGAGNVWMVAEELVKLLQNTAERLKR